MPSPKREPEYHEGPDAARSAETVLRRILTVPKEELTRREAQYQKSRKAKSAPSRKPHR
jgi:hypothetical protein